MPKGKHVRIPHFSITISIKFNDMESMKKCFNSEEFQNVFGKLTSVVLMKGAKYAKTSPNPEI